MLKVSNTLIESLITHAYKFPQPSAQEYFDRHPLRRISKLIGKSKCLLYEGKATQTPPVLFSLETLSQRCLQLGRRASSKMAIPSVAVNPTLSITVRVVPVSVLTSIISLSTKLFTYIKSLGAKAKLSIPGCS